MSGNKLILMHFFRGFEELNCKHDENLQGTADRYSENEAAEGPQDCMLAD